MESVIVLRFVVRYFMSILVLQSSWWGREIWLLCLIGLPGVSWWLSGSSSRCHGVVCSLWLWYFLIILTYYFWITLYTVLMYFAYFCMICMRYSLTPPVHGLRCIAINKILFFSVLFSSWYVLSYLWPVTRKGASWASYSEIHFLRSLNRESYEESSNITILVGSWSFWVSKYLQKMGTVLPEYWVLTDGKIPLKSRF